MKFCYEKNQYNQWVPGFYTDNPVEDRVRSTVWDFEGTLDEAIATYPAPHNDDSKRYSTPSDTSISRSTLIKQVLG